LLETAWWASAVQLELFVARVWRWAAAPRRQLDLAPWRRGARTPPVLALCARLGDEATNAVKDEAPADCVKTASAASTPSSSLSVSRVLERLTLWLSASTPARVKL
jgi:hypothetical protein